ncbi:hypothetical protein G3N57_22455, partial [Paraburkholderia sp. Se-20369]|nr:hypothetical protein [Paraburkholderia sp. Se-20369]
MIAVVVGIPRAMVRARRARNTIWGWHVVQEAVRRNAMVRPMAADRQEGTPLRRVFHENPVILRPRRGHGWVDKLAVPDCRVPDSASMSYWRKFFIVVLLALSLPGQSFAAAAMSCAAAG